MLEVDEVIGGPEPFAQLVAGHQLARPLDQCLQNLNRLIGNFEAGRSLPKLAAANIELERPELDVTRRHSGIVHGV